MNAFKVIECGHRAFRRQWIAQHVQPAHIKDIRSIMPHRLDMSV